MAYIPPQIIEETKNIASIAEIIGEYVSLRKVGKNYLGLCPFHQERTPSFTVNEEKQIFHCFGCGIGGNVFTFLMKYKQYSFYEAVEEIANLYGVVLPKEKSSSKEEAIYRQRKSLFTINRLAAEFYHHYLLKNTEAKRAREYLAKRGIGKDTIVTYLLGYAPSNQTTLTKILEQKGVDLSMAVEAGLVLEKERAKVYDRFWHRIMFPIFDVKGNIIAFGGRVLNETLPKYINSPETLIYKKGFSLYGVHVAKQWCQKQEKVLLTEGYFDLLTLHACGIKYSVATLGTALTPTHVRILKSLAPKVILVYDADSAGRKAAIRSLPLLLKEDLTVDILLLPSGDDPDSFVQREGKEAMFSLLEETNCLLDWYLKQGETETRYDLKKRYQFLQEAFNIISFIKNPLMQSYYRDKICELFHIEVSVALNLKKKNKPSQGIEGNSPLEETLPPFEKNVVKFLLRFPEYISWFNAETLLSEIKHPVVSLILKQMLNQYKTTGHIEVSSLMIEMDESLQKFISRWALENVEHYDCKEIANGLLLQLRKRRFKSLLKKIKEAEEKRDWDKLLLLLKEKNKIACGLKISKECHYE
jgi:DNA primase